VTAGSPEVPISVLGKITITTNWSSISSSERLATRLGVRFNTDMRILEDPLSLSVQT
jgi:hypothetical protein